MKDQDIKTLENNITFFKEEETGPTTAVPTAKRIPLKYLHLHTPLFLGGKNFKDKIEAKSGVWITHYIDGIRDEIHISHGDHHAYLPRLGNVALAIPYDPKEADIVAVKVPQAMPVNPEPQPKFKAQVSAPAGIKI